MLNSFPPEVRRSKMNGVPQSLALYDMPGHLIRRLQQIAVSIWLDETSDSELRPVQFAALSAIRAFPGMDQMALSRVIAFDRSTIQDVVVRVVKRGWVRRDADPEDRRRRVLFLTQAGEEVLDATIERNLRAQQRILAPLSPEDQVQFMRMLSTLVQVNNQFSRAPLVEGQPAGAG
jgi:MarR family transcriptional regulator, lower aerobic nicotinate degradation pathway regulator